MRKYCPATAAIAAVAISSFAQAATRDVSVLPTAAYRGAVAGSLQRAQQEVQVSPDLGVLGTIFNANGFEAPAYATGNLIGQNTWSQLNIPPGTATYTVGATTGVGGSQGVTANGTGTSFAFPDTPVVTPVAGERVSVNVDIARTVAATAALSSANYNVDVYSTTTRVTRFGLSRSMAASGTTPANSIQVFVTAPFNTTTGQFQAGQPLFNVSLTGPLVANTYYNLEARLNYATQSMDLFSNNAVFFPGIPFATAAAGGAGMQTNFAEADLSIGTGLIGDIGLFDNYRLAVVPEPTTLAVLAGGAVLGLRRRRA